MNLSPDYEKGYEDGLRDGHQTVAITAVSALELALMRLEVSDYDGDEREFMTTIRQALDELRPFVKAG